jgi:hypothetical protein
MRKKVKVAARDRSLAPRRTVARGEAAAPLTAAPAQILAAADELSALETQMGDPAAGAEAADAVEVEYDDRARDMAVRAARVLETEPALSEETGVTAARLDARVSQYGEAHTNRLTLEDAEAEIDETLEVVGQREQHGQRALLKAVRAELARLPHGSDAWRKLKSDAADLLEWDRKRREKAQKKTEETKAAHAAQAEVVAQARKKKKRAKTLHDLQAGKPVDPADEDEVLEAYGESEDE